MSLFSKKDEAADKVGEASEESKSAEGKQVIAGSLKTPRAAAIAGIIFSVLIATSSVMIRLSLPGDPAEAGRWLDDNGLRDTVRLALNLVPFAGIAFLWFIGVIRDRLGEREDRFFATVFLGSGILYIAMLFASAAIAAGLISSYNNPTDAMVNSGVWVLNRDACFALVNVYAMKMAAVFTISSATLFLRTSTAPRVLSFLGYAIALVLIFAIGLLAWLSLLFPAWVLLVSIYVLVASFRKGQEA